MGVMACRRNNCENVMCNRYSGEYGYICSECFDELVSMGPETNTAEFMNTPKINVDRAAATWARFDVEFPLIEHG